MTKELTRLTCIRLMVGVTFENFRPEFKASKELKVGKYGNAYYSYERNAKNEYVFDKRKVKRFNIRATVDLGYCEKNLQVLTDKVNTYRNLYWDWMGEERLISYSKDRKGQELKPVSLVDIIEKLKNDQKSTIFATQRIRVALKLLQEMQKDTYFDYEVMVYEY